VTLLLHYRTLFTSHLQENRARLQITIFCKSLYTFLFLKIVFLWPLLSDGQRYFPYEFRSSLHHLVYAPIRLAQYDLTIFLVSILILLSLALLLKINYVTAALIFWFSFSLTRFAIPFTNGSDYVLNLFLLLSILLPIIPSFKSEALRDKQFIISNFVFLFCKIQLALIYVLSGFDKLTSPAWRSGDAVYSIANLDLFMNPHLSIPASKTLYLFLAWAIILFELAFPLLIWFKRFRIYALAAGVIFHLVIIFGLSLPDFGLVMILLYSLFIPVRDKQKPDYESSLR
jgi:hypothetical protein